MLTIKIEKNIPIPQGSNKGNIYPFKDMEVGDSILVIPKSNGLSAAAAFRSYINYNRLDWRIKTKTEFDGIRIWRI